MAFGTGFYAAGIRIGVPKPNPDPGGENSCGSRSATLLGFAPPPSPAWLPDAVFRWVPRSPTGSGMQLTHKTILSVKNSVAQFKTKTTFRIVMPVRNQLFRDALKEKTGQGEMYTTFCFIKAFVVVFHGCVPSGVGSTNMTSHCSSAWLPESRFRVPVMLLNRYVDVTPF